MKSKKRQVNKKAKKERKKERNKQTTNAKNCVQLVAKKKTTAGVFFWQSWPKVLKFLNLNDVWEAFLGG